MRADVAVVQVHAVGHRAGLYQSPPQGQRAHASVDAARSRGIRPSARAYTPNVRETLDVRGRSGRCRRDSATFDPHTLRESEGNFSMRGCCTSQPAGPHGALSVRGAKASDAREQDAT